MQLFIHSMSTKPHYKAPGIQLGSEQKRPCSQGAYTLTGRCIHKRQCSAMVYSQPRCPGTCARGVQPILSGPQGSLVKVKSELQPEDKMLMQEVIGAGNRDLGHHRQQDKGPEERERKRGITSGSGRWCKVRSRGLGDVAGEVDSSFSTESPTEL